MKPYKLIKSKNPLPKRYIIKKESKPPEKMPLRLFTKVNPPKRIEWVYETILKNPLPPDQNKQHQ